MARRTDRRRRPGPARPTPRPPRGPACRTYSPTSPTACSLTQPGEGPCRIASAHPAWFSSGTCSTVHAPGPVAGLHRGPGHEQAGAHRTEGHRVRTGSPPTGLPPAFTFSGRSSYSPWPLTCCCRRPGRLADPSWAAGRPGCRPPGGRRTPAAVGRRRAAGTRRLSVAVGSSPNWLSSPECCCGSTSPIPCICRATCW